LVNLPCDAREARFKCSYRSAPYTKVMEADHVQDATADAFSCLKIAATDDRSPKAVIGDVDGLEVRVEGEMTYSIVWA